MTEPTLTRVTVVCVTYNSAPVLRALAVTLARFRNVVVIDNGSRDDTLQQVRAHVPHARVIARSDNAGFGVANNQAMQQVETEYALLLNPDCQIEPDAVDLLQQTLDAHPDAGIVAHRAGAARPCHRNHGGPPSSGRSLPASTGCRINW